MICLQLELWSNVHTLVKNMHIKAVLNSNDFYNSRFFCDGMSGMHSNTQKYTHSNLNNQYW